MNNLIPLTKAEQKRLGIVQGKEGFMIDSKRLAEIKKFERKAKDGPQVEIKKVKVEDMIKKTVNQNDEARGIY